MSSGLPNWLHVYESKSGLETLMELYNDQGTGNPCLPATLVLPWEHHPTHLNFLIYQIRIRICTYNKVWRIKKDAIWQHCLSSVAPYSNINFQRPEIIQMTKTNLLEKRTLHLAMQIFSSLLSCNSETVGLHPRLSWRDAPGQSYSYRMPQTLPRVVWNKR